MIIKEVMKKVQMDDRSIYSMEIRSEMEGGFIGHIRGDLCRTFDDFLREVSASFRFPYYFGWNWPAFDECMCDLDWLKFSSLFIVIDKYELVFCDEGENADLYNKKLVEHLSSIIEYWSSKEVPIRIILNCTN